MLKSSLLEDPALLEIGVDEVGRGSLLGRVYTGAVILPPPSSDFDFGKMKDSKKFHSSKKIQETAQYIRENAVAWTVTYRDETRIDEINILQATQESMHESIQEILTLMPQCGNFHLLIDGNYFKPFLNPPIQHTCLEGGDNAYCSIAAASILAKVARDQYIMDLCKEHPDLQEKYNLESNKGYGTKKHREGILTHGITKWHRKTFGCCKEYG